jgi:MFS family permease
VLFALYGAADSVFSPASTGLVPETVSPARLQEANALMGLSRSAALVAGPLIAGLLVAGAGAGWAFVIDAGTFAVSSLSLAFLRLPRTVQTAQSTVVADLRAGWREVRWRPWATTTIARFSLSNLALAPLFVLGPIVAQDSLGGAAAWGVIGTAGGVGSAFGAGVALRVRPQRPLFAGALAVSLCALEPALLARPFSTLVLAASAAVGFGAMSFSNALWFTTLQRKIPREALSRVSSYDWLGSLALQPVGYALAGPAAAAFGTSATLLGAAATQATICVGAAFIPAVHGLRMGEHPELARPESSKAALS